MEPTDKGRAAADMIRQGFSLRHWHEIETGCSADALCSDCREIDRKHEEAQ
ncbi:hypothetical protein SEA_ODAY_99 [Gordonia phage ODay]|nr:hypothetical protein SEA_ODAY_99 [Gordonia phage ODay]